MTFDFDYLICERDIKRKALAGTVYERTTSVSAIALVLMQGLCISEFPFFYLFFFAHKFENFFLHFKTYIYRAS